MQHAPHIAKDVHGTGVARVMASQASRDMAHGAYDRLRDLQQQREGLKSQLGDTETQLTELNTTIERGGKRVALHLLDQRKSLVARKNKLVDELRRLNGLIGQASDAGQFDQMTLRKLSLEELQGQTALLRHIIEQLRAMTAAIEALAGDGPRAPRPVETPATNWSQL